MALNCEMRDRVARLLGDAGFRPGRPDRRGCVRQAGWAVTIGRDTRDAGVFYLAKVEEARTRVTMLAQYTKVLREAGLRVCEDPNGQSLVVKAGG